MTETILRPARAADAEALQSLYVRALTCVAPDRAMPRRPPDRLDLSRRVGPEDRILVADKAGQPVGFALLSPDGEITGPFVDPAFRRRGIGRMLAEGCEGDARGLDAETLSVMADPAAAEFWRRLGFERAGDGRTAGGPAPRFAKRLRTAAH